MQYLSAITCDEPDGNEIVPEVGDTAHTVMIRESGQCPWCGETVIY